MFPLNSLGQDKNLGSFADIIILPLVGYLQKKRRRGRGQAMRSLTVLFHKIVNCILDEIITLKKIKRAKNGVKTVVIEPGKIQVVPSMSKCFNISINFLHIKGITSCARKTVGSKWQCVTTFKMIIKQRGCQK